MQRWEARPDAVDARKGPKTKPRNAITKEEEKAIINIACGEEFADKSPRQIVPILAERGIYIASESTFYRVLHANGLMAHRGKAKPRRHPRPEPHTATGPNQVWSWDITYLPAPIAGTFFYLYLVMDIYSRKIVGWEVHDTESDTLSSALIQGIIATEHPDKPPVLHSDNGGPMKGATMKATLERLGVHASFSRPATSNDNPYSESLFRTVKYRPEYPTDPFPSIHAARTWVAQFEHWYNDEHRHSKTNFVTPNQRHTSQDEEVLDRREAIYKAAKNTHPERWSGPTRNWQKPGPVTLNPTHRRTPPPCLQNATVTQ